MEHRSGESGSGGPGVAVEELALQRREEGLGDAVDAPMCQDVAETVPQDAFRRSRQGGLGRS